MLRSARQINPERQRCKRDGLRVWARLGPTKREGKGAEWTQLLASG